MWFNKQKKEVALTMGRVINASADVCNPMEDEDVNRREDMRSIRSFPVLLAPHTEDPDTQLSRVCLGITRDLSCEGVGVVTLGRVGFEEALIVTRGTDDNLLAFRGELRNERHLGFGYFINGIQLLRRLENNCLASIEKLIHELESTAMPV
tara:strand:+ start:166 stop:618 length:453 start_codon:yes stop_codon:yes gene_type:complete